MARVEQPGVRSPAPEALQLVQDLVNTVDLEAGADELRTAEDAAGWARLVRSYAVLGDTAKMNAALEEARRIFKDKPSERAAIEAAADKPQ